MSPQWVSLEVELQRKLHDSAAMLVGNSAKVIDGVLRESISFLRITHPGPYSTSTVRGRTQAVAICILVQRNRVQRQIDIAIRRVSYIVSGRVGLIEDIEEACPELKFLRLGEVEVLKERHVKVRPCGSAKVERWLRRSTLAKRRDLQCAQVEYFGPYAAGTVANRRIASIDRCDSTDTLTQHVECVRAVPCNGSAGARYISAKS